MTVETGNRMESGVNNQWNEVGDRTFDIQPIEAAVAQELVGGVQEMALPERLREERGEERRGEEREGKGTTRTWCHSESSRSVSLFRCGLRIGP